MLRSEFEDWISKPSPDQPLWRYMSFGKFASLLETKSLFFAQVKRMADKYEGFVHAPPGSDLHNYITNMREIPNSPWSHGVITCWCASEHESDALWGRFEAGSESVAICTTAEKLAKAVTQSSTPLAKNLFAGLVQYRNPPLPNAQPGEKYGFDVNLFFKRPEFSAENEYRVLGHARDFWLADKLGGVLAPVDLDSLIDRVCVSPSSSIWFSELVRTIANGRIPSAQVVRSTIGENPYEDE